jgi:biopolymer transport protein ExbD
VTHTWERHLNLFSLAFLGVALGVFVLTFAGAPIVCGVSPFVQLPWSSTAERLVSSDVELHVFVKKDRSVFVGRAILPIRSLRDELTTIHEQTGERIVVVEADASVPFGLIADVLRASRDAGFGNASLMTFRGNALEASQRLVSTAAVRVTGAESRSAR